MAGRGSLLCVAGEPGIGKTTLVEDFFARLGREVSHANSLAFALTAVAAIYQCCGYQQRVGELAEEAAALCAEQGLPHWLGQTTAARGWVRVGRGEAAEGIEEMRRGLAAYRFTGAAVHLTCHLCLLAEAHGKAGSAKVWRC